MFNYAYMVCPLPSLGITKPFLLAPHKAKAYGTFNPKWLYIDSMAVFEGGSALCGGAPNMNALIIGRTIAGVGVCCPPPTCPDVLLTTQGSRMYLRTITLLTITTTVQERPNYIGLSGLA